MNVFHLDFNLAIVNSASCFFIMHQGQDHSYKCRQDCCACSDLDLPLVITVWSVHGPGSTTELISKVLFYFYFYFLGANEQGFIANQQALASCFDHQ